MNDNRRRSIRLSHYDYGRCGAYFVTICVQDRVSLFGRIVGGDLSLSQFGRLVSSEWRRTPVVRPIIGLDEFVIMPNHIHGIINILESGRSVLPYAPPMRPVLSQTLGAIIRGFKAATTKRINEVRKTPGAPVWQRNYYEHVIRNENELDRIRQYVANNPLQWSPGPGKSGKGRISIRPYRWYRGNFRRHAPMMPFIVDAYCIRP